MPVLFVSHSSKDDAAAGALEAWLRANGFTDIFVDHQNILGGDKWREKLRASAAACRVVICLVTENWLKSDECFGEFVAAAYTMGRRIIPLFSLSPTPKPSAGAETPSPRKTQEGMTKKARERLAKVLSEYQGIKLDTCMTADGVLNLDADPGVANRLRDGLRAAGALSDVGLDPEAFEINRELRPTPFPGLASFGDDDADAAVFYGRSREIALALEELRKMRAERDQRPFVILGASGAGKSSLLKAGIIPRLRRERPAWLPMRAFRPGSDPLLNFAEAFARTLADFDKVEAHGVIRDRLLAAWSSAERNEKSELTPTGQQALEAALEAEAQALRTAAGLPSATILVSIDQAEEIAHSDDTGAQALADYLRVAMVASQTEWLLAFTIRTDSFPELQSHRRFRGLEARSFDLRAMPSFSFKNVVEEPAKRYGVKIDPNLVDALMENTPGADALPLLAFALQRLWRQFAGSGVLTKDNYDKLGGLRGLIEDAAERALRGLEPGQDVPLPSTPPSKELLALGASTLPALAQLNEQGATIRRVAGWTSFDDKQQELLLQFIRWYLVVRKGGADGGTDGGTVEVSHEALFREWTRLNRWLEPERARLDALRSLQIDALTWDRNNRDDAFLNHRGKRLAAAKALVEIQSYRKRLGRLELDYLAACRTAEQRPQPVPPYVKALVGVLLLAMAAGLAAWWKGPWLKEQAYWLLHARALTAAEERALGPRGLPFTECTHCPAMVVVPAGSFTMGSAGEPRERPPHTVTISRPFAVSKSEVTFDEWDACVAYGDCAPDIGTAGWGRGSQPVIYVTWSEAQRYVKWLSRVTGRPYRLLTEAEWEYAARSQTTTGSTTHYSFGNDETPLGDHGWFADNADGRAHPVKEKKANPFGLNDMYGNVAEWVEDCFSENYRDARSDGSAWMPANCTRRVIRGGSYQDRAKMLRSASREWATFDKPEKYIGFRVGRTLAAEP